jgi:hypothetical protein
MQQGLRQQGYKNTYRTLMGMIIKIILCWIPIKINNDNHFNQRSIAFNWITYRMKTLNRYTTK